MPYDKVTGIYKIVNVTNGKFYVGSSKDIGGRWRNHVMDLRRKQHHCAALQHAWNKYGESSFAVQLLETCAKDREKLVDLEQHYIDDLKPEYNSSLTASSTLGIVHSEQARKNMSEAAKRRKRTPLSDETKAKISSANRGKKRTPETIERMTESAKGRKLSDDHKAKLSKALRGRGFSETTRKKISEARRKQGVPIENLEAAWNSRRGKSLSVEHRSKLSEANKKYWEERRRRGPNG